MEVTDDVVKDIAELTQIRVNDKDIKKLSKGMQNILILADQMKNLDTENVDPISNPLDDYQRLRPDSVTEENHRSLFQSLAPVTADGLYLVPKVIE